MSVLTCNLMHDHEFDWIPNPWIPDRIHDIGDCNQAGWFEKRRENCQKPIITVEALLTSFPAAVFCLRTRHIQIVISEIMNMTNNFVFV